ncbi:MAG TPA: hypothetical protein VK358_01655, partial [Longimicrobium sp.]|nr:hypothetical protein [Longimicrobium sp.]
MYATTAQTQAPFSGLTPYADESFQLYLPPPDADGTAPALILDVEDSLEIGAGPVPGDLTAYSTVRIYAENVSITGTVLVNDAYV